MKKRDGVLGIAVEKAGAVGRKTEMEIEAAEGEMKGVLGKRDMEVRQGEGWLGWRRPLERWRLGSLSSERGLRLGRGKRWRRGRDLAGWRPSWRRYEAASLHVLQHLLTRSFQSHPALSLPIPKSRSPPNT